MPAALLSLLLTPVLALQVVGVVSGLLDPLPITTWKSSWLANSIDLSSNVLSQMSVTVTLNINLSTSLTNGVLEVTFPTGFGVSGLPGATGQIVQKALTATAGTDIGVDFTGVVNPSTAGPYGPFALRTRYLAGGQVVDANLNFGFIYITVSPSQIGGLTVGLHPGSSSAVNIAGNTLSFKFSIQADLWQHDLFRVGISQYWTVGSSVSCVSFDSAGRVNNFNGTSTNSPHQLNCAVSAKVAGQGQFVYIYGLSVDDIDVSIEDNRYVNLLISPVTNPDRIYSSVNYQWTLETMRFGTKTVLQTGAYNSGPTTTAGSITSLNWKLTWIPANFAVVNGYQAFTDTVFSITGAIPNGGSVSLLYSDSVAVSSWAGVSCYIVTYLSATAACTAPSAQSLSLTNLPDLPRDSSIIVRAYSLFSTAAGGAAKVTSITTYDSTLRIIDQGFNLGNIPVVTNTAGRLATDFTIDFYGISRGPSLNLAGGTGDVSLYVYLYIRPLVGTDFVTTTTVTVSCPLAAQGGDLVLSIPSSGRIDEWRKDNRAMDAGPPVVFNSGGSGNGSTLSVTPGSGASLGTVQFTIGANMLPIASYLSVGMHVSSGSITLPYVVNNAATAYECTMLLQDSTGVKTTQRYAKQFTIASQVWSTASFSYFCQSNYAGAPVRFVLKTGVRSIVPQSGVTYYIEFELSPFPAFHNSNLVEGDPYPVQTSLTLITPTMTIHTGGGSTIWHRLSGFSDSFSTTNTVEVYFPVGQASPLSVTAVVRSFYYLNTDSRVKYKTHESGPFTYTVINAAAGNTFANSPSFTGSVTNGDAVPASGLLISLKATTLLNPAPGVTWAYFIFPQGFTWTSGKSVSIGGAPFVASYFFTSTKLRFAFPGLLMKQTTTGSAYISNTAASALLIFGLKYAIGVPASSLAVTAVNGPANGVLTGVCQNENNALGLSPGAGAITDVTIHPKSILAQGPGGVDVTHTLTFTLTHGIDLGGLIKLTMQAAWTVTSCTECVVTGLVAAAGLSVQCLGAGNIFTISGFADFSTVRSTTLSLTISHLLPPASPSANYSFVTILGSYTSTGLVIDSFVAAGVNPSSVVVASALATGTTTYLVKQTLPQSAGLQAVDLYLKFSLSHSNPACGTLAITSPLAWKLPSGDCKNVCYLTGALYKDCAVTGSGLTLTLSTNYIAGSALELFCESAVDNPNTQGVTPTGFKVISSWFGAVIDTDGSSVSSQQLFNTAAPLPVALSASTTGTTTVDPKNRGELATYTFAFNSILDFTPSQQLWVQFPQEYDYYLGDAEMTFQSDTGTYYLPCSCPGLSASTCAIDHRVLVIAFDSVVPAGTLVTVYVSNVKNPIVTQTGYFRLYLVDSVGNALAASPTFAQVTLTAPAALLDIRSAQAMNPVLYSASDYGFRVYIYQAITANHEVRLQFPPEYALWRVSSLACSTTWVDDTTATTNRLPQVWNNNGACGVAGNTAILGPPGSSITFSVNSIVYFNYTAVVNPEYGRTRTAYQGSLWDFEVYDTAVWPVYPYWTRKFAFFVYDKSNKVYTSRSYANLNAAYIGLTAAHKQIGINSYQANSKNNRIQVWAGSQSTDLQVSTQSLLYPCQSQSLTFTPSLSGNATISALITFSSIWHQFIMFQDDVRINFRVAVAGSTPKGLYYVQWKVEEIKQTGVRTSPYDPPAQTLLEVVPASKGKYAFQITPIPLVQRGLSSMPITISTPNAPHSDVTISIGILNEPANVSVQPASLTFLQDINSLTFQVLVSEDYDMLTGATVVLTFNLTGTNANLYSVSSTVTVEIIESTLVTAGRIFGLGLGVPTRTAVSFTPTTDQSGLLYYLIAPLGTAVPAFSLLRTRVQNEQKSLMSVLYHNITYATNETRYKETQPRAGETWSDFERRLFTSHLGSTWVGSIPMNPKDSPRTVTVDWLWAGTGYQLVAYFDNMKADTEGSPANLGNFTTAASADCQPYTLNFLGLVDNVDSSVLVNTMAEYAGVNPARILQTQRLVSRRLAGEGTSSVTATAFSFILLHNRFTDLPDPKTQLTLSNNDYANLISSLKTQGIPNTLFTFTLDPVPSRGLPMWKTLPSVGQITSQSVSVNYAAQIEGQTCCIALTSATTYPTGEQMMLGLDAFNSPVPYACKANDQSVSINTVTVGGLGAVSQYYMACTTTDTYPVFPSQIQYADSLQRQYASAVTLGLDNITPTNNTEGAVQLASLSLLLLIALVS